MATSPGLHANANKNRLFMALTQEETSIDE